MKTASQNPLASGLIAATMVSILASCGPMKSSDPTRDFKDLGDFGKVHNERPRTQEFVAAEVLLFRAQKEGEDEVRDLRLRGLHFQVGEPTVYIVKPATTLPGVLFDIVLHEKPADDMALARIGTTNEWRLTWTPKADVIPAGQTSREHFMKIEFRPLPGTAPASMATLNTLHKVLETRVEVRQIETQASITRVNGLGDGAEVKEGETLRYSIEVSDPAASAANPPRLIKPEQTSASTELYEADGSSMDMPDPAKPAPEQKGNGVWVFDRLFQARNVPPHLNSRGEADLTAPSVTVRFAVGVIGAGSRSPVERTFKVKINFNRTANAPLIRAGRANLIVFEAGVDKDIDFTAVTSNPNGRVEVDVAKMRAELAAWPGSPAVTCEDASATPQLQSCTFTWNPPCDANFRDQYQLNIEAKNTVFGRSQSARVQRTVRVVKFDSNCRSAARPAPQRQQTPPQQAVPTRTNTPAPQAQQPAQSRGANPQAPRSAAAGNGGPQ